MLIGSTGAEAPLKHRYYLYKKTRYEKNPAPISLCVAV